MILWTNWNSHLSIFLSLMQNHISATTAEKEAFKIEPKVNELTRHILGVFDYLNAFSNTGGLENPIEFSV